MRAGNSLRAGAFTIVELLVVIAIIAIMASMLAPVIHSVKSSVGQSVAVRVGGQVLMASTLYMGDHDDRYPLAMYTVEYGAWQTWFGRQTGYNEFDIEEGLLGPYMGPRRSVDPSHRARPYIGDMSGFGYNYGYIGGDFYVTGDFSRFPNCRNPASGSDIESPSTTIVFATTSYYYPTWLEGGDGQTYDFGFFDPPGHWFGNPNVDFRHFGGRTEDPETREVVSDGRAVMVFADGNVRPMSEPQVEPEMFRRRS